MGKGQVEASEDIWPSPDVVTKPVPSQSTPGRGCLMVGVPTTLAPQEPPEVQSLPSPAPGRPLLTLHRLLPPTPAGNRLQAPSWVPSILKGQEKFDTGKAISDFLLAVIG